MVKIFEYAPSPPHLRLYKKGGGIIASLQVTVLQGPCQHTVCTFNRICQNKHMYCPLNYLIIVLQLLHGSHRTKVGYYCLLRYLLILQLLDIETILFTYFNIKNYTGYLGYKDEISTQLFVVVCNQEQDIKRIPHEKLELP